MSAETRIRRLEREEPSLVSLIQQSDELLQALYPPESTHLESIAALLRPEVGLFGAYIGDELAACGAAKLKDDDGVYGEIKRVFVAEAHRRKGLARAIMSRLEAYLLERGVSLVRLETGVKQQEAIVLYRSLDYRERGPFGDYSPDPLSVFMEKTVSS